MKSKYKLVLVFISVLMSFNLYAANSKILEWEDLIPATELLILDAWQKQVNSSHDFPLDPPANIGKVRADLNGSNIKIAGFVIPLEGDEETISELLLVPYFGACFHVPPPPANQIIHVTFQKPVQIKELWDVVYVKGELKTQTTINQFAEVGYSMDGFAIETYEE